MFIVPGILLSIVSVLAFFMKDYKKVCDFYLRHDSGHRSHSNFLIYIYVDYAGVFHNERRIGSRGRARSLCVILISSLLANHDRRAYLPIMTGELTCQS
mgnify:CR=1 FL=1